MRDQDVFTSLSEKIGNLESRIWNVRGLGENLDAGMQKSNLNSAETKSEIWNAECTM